MTKSVSKIIRGGVSAKKSAGFLAAKFAVLAFAAFLFCLSSCDVGLGESVDTQAPAIEITYPPVSAVIRDSFILYGSWTDDKSVSKISVSVMNTETKEVVLSNASAEIGSGSWQIELNNKDDSNENYYNGWQFADGTYQISVVATDNAGHTSGTVSRTFDIDNTPPVFVISNPGVVKNGTSSASAYGSIFTIDGTIADDHTISSMDVTIYDSNGNIVSKETYDGEEIEAFHEDDISTAGGTSVTIAQYGENQNGRYEAIYGEDETAGTKKYTCSIKLTDSAQVYQSPTDSSSRSAEQVKADSAGNATYSLYLYDDVYTTLMSAKKGLGLSAADLKNILNKTVKNGDALEILESKKTDTEGKVDSSNLFFSLNPQANPTYQVNGFEYSFLDGATLQQASSGNTVSVTVTAGLDGTNIDPDGNDSQKSTVKVWLKEYDEQPKDSGKYTKDSVLAELSSLATYVAQLEDSETDFVELANATDSNSVTEFDSWKLIYDYAQQTAGSDESSTATKTFSVALPQNSISLNKYYMIAVTGSDVEDVHFLQTKAYGFEGNEAGVAPTIKIESPSNSSLVASSDFSFTGTAVVKSSSLYVKTLTATLTATDQDTNKEIATFSQTISSSADKVWSAESGSSLKVFSCDSSGNWTFTPSKLSGYSTIEAAENSGKSYLYTLEIYGAASSGHDTTVSSNVQIDAVLPKIEISSITPTVDGGEYDSSSNTYVNGTITVKGTVEETNLESVSMQIFVDGCAVSYWTDSNGNASDTLNLGKVYSFSTTIDTADKKITDEKSLDVRVTATDKVGNSKTYSSLTDSTSYSKLVISQETDKPVITLNNATVEGFTDNADNINANNGNLFGTISNNKISVSVSDDDLVKSVKMKVYKYKEDETTLVDSTSKDDIGKSTYSNSFVLPSDEGVYVVEITATDDVLSTDLSGRTPVTSTKGPFFIAVSAGAPTISLDSVATYQTSKPSFSGTVSSKESDVSAEFSSAKINNSALDETALKELSQKFEATKAKDSTSWTVSLKDGESLANGEYSVSFTASNDYGEKNSVKASFTVDSEAPTLKITEYNSIKSENENGFTTEQIFYLNPSNIKTIKGTCSDNINDGIDSVYYYVGDIAGKETPSTKNGWLLANLTKTSNEIGWTVSLTDLGNLTEGETYSVHIKATDKAGNVSDDYCYISLYIDETGPELTASVPNSDLTYTKDEKTYRVYGSNSFNVSVTAEDVAGVASVSANSTSLVKGDDGNYSGTVSVTPDSDGFATINVVAMDSVGNSSEKSIDDIMIDLTAPTVTISSYPENATKDEFTLTGTVSDNIGVKSVVITDSIDSAKSYTAEVSSDGKWSVTLKPTANGEGENETKDGSHTYTATATDKVGNTSTATCRVTTDTTAPYWYTGNKDSAEPYISTKSSSEKITDVEYSLYGSTSVTVAAKAKDATTSVSSLLYNLNDEKDDSSALVWKSADNGNFSVENLSQGVNSLKIKAVDEAGNENSPYITLSFFVDSLAPAEPALKSVDSDSDESSMADFIGQNKQKLVNGNSDVVFTVEAADTVSGDASSGENSYSGIASVELTKIGNTAKSISGILVSEENGKSVYSITIPKGDLASGSATVTVKDKAGNATTLGMFNLLLDNKAPTVTLTAPADADSSTSERDVNKIISLSGNASDNQTLDESSVYLEYSTDNANWEILTTENAGENYKVEWNSGISTSGIDTSKFADKSTVYIRAAAKDEAGNTGYSDSVALYVNQDTDRPVVKISNLTKLSGGFILKYGTDAQVTGTVSDDDSTSSAVVESLVISESPYNGSGDVENLASFNPVSGDFTFTPSSKEDGEKTFYIYIKDNGGNEFYTTASTGTDSSGNTTYLENPRLYLKTDSLEDSLAAASFTYKSDSASPQVGNVEGKISASSAVEKTSYSGISVSFVAGGDDRYLNLRVTASDANGIDGILLDVTDSNGNTLFKRATASVIAENAIDSSTNESDGNFTLSGSSVTGAEKYYVNSSDSKTSDGTSYVWELASALDLGSVSTGSLTITVKPYDNSGLFGNGSYTFMVDNSGPSVKMTSPSSSTIVSGSSISVSGTATEIGSSLVDSIQWLIPETEQQGWTDSALNALEWKGELSKVSTASAWTFVFNGTDNAILSDFTKDETYASPDSDGVYSLPIYFKATDALGNYTICKDYSIRYNPDADRPVTQITYPDSSILSKDSNGDSLDYAVLGGKIRVTGTVEIPSGDSTAYQVYLQVSDNNGNFDDSDKTTAKDIYNFTVLEADELESAWKNAQGSTASLNFSNDSSANTEKRNAWWGIPATLYSSKTSWYIVINDKEQMNVKNGTNNVKIRVCGVGENGKVGLWSDSYSIHIDSQVPRYSESPLLYQYASELSTGDAFYSASPSSAQSYSAGVYLKGQWYLCTSVTDETPVKVNSVSLGSTSLSYGTNYFVWPESANNSGGNAAGSEQKDSSGRNIAYVYIKIDTDKTSTQSYTITAEDSDANGSNTSAATFEVNADNVAPIFSLNSNGKPVITDGNDSEISMTKLKNSDHVVTFGSTATDTGSGFERIAFYFARTADGKTTVELPIPSLNGSAWENSSSAAYVGDSSGLTVDSDLNDAQETNYSANALYGVTLSGTSSVDSSANTTTFTAGSDISSYKFIRAGGIIKLSGIYYTISSVSGNAITVEGAVSTSPETAFAPAALIVDNTSAESIGTWSSGFVINGDDGDGIIESVKKSGSTWTWSASVYLDELEDGPVTLVAMAFDKAGNVRTLETPVMIANNTPRLAKVYLATDLNGDGKFTDNELGTSTMADTNETQKFYSALTNGTSGRSQEILTIENASGSGVTGITMRNDIGLSFEFVSGSGNEGYGSGNRTLYYKLAVSDSALNAATSGTDGTLETADSDSYDKTSETTTAGIVESGLKGFKIPTSKFKYGSATSGFDYNEWASSNVSNGKDSNKINYIGVTLWDSTKGTTAGTGDTTDSDGNITAFGSQWTVVNIPLYIDLVDDQFPVPLISDPTSDSSSGHVDLSGTLPSANFAGTSGEFDTDTKISGTVVFTGTVTDEKRVDSIYLTASKKFSSASVSFIKIASYDSASGSFSLTQPATGLEFAITSNEFSTESGHTVGWSLTVDTSKVEGVASGDVKFTVAASDGTNTNASGSAVEPAEYQADIVPYITKIVRSSTSKSNTAMNRSTYGEYPVALGDNLTVSGFNFGTSPTVKVGSTALSVSNADGTSFTIGAPANSGELTVTVNGIVSLNDKNNNSSETNLDSDGKFDNRYIRVWDVGHYFSNSDGGNEPTMVADNSGNIFSTWTLMGTGSVQMQRGLSTVNQPIYIGYDQPDKETALAVDKSKASGDVSVLFYPANVGSSGTPDSTCYADARTVGGVWGLNLKNDFSSSSNYKYTVNGNKKYLSIVGNPYYVLDSKINTSGYQLASGSMRREVSQFQNGHTVRYGDNMHYVYYDSYNKSLRYTFQKAGYKISSNNPLTEKATYPLSTTANETADRKDIVGWILIDGKSDEQDRIHRWTDNDLENIWSNNDGGVSKFTDSNGSLGSDGKSVYINYNCSGAKALALAYTDESGVYKVDLHTVSSISSNGKNLYWTDHEFPKNSNGTYYTPTGLCIYHGDSNVVTNGVTQITSSAEGKYSSIDVTSMGKPVIVYYDSANDTLRIAYASDSDINMYSSSEGCGKFTRQTISGVSGGTYVQAKIDGNNYLHIMYRDSDGKLCYLKSTNNPDGAAYTFGSPMTIDSSGTYGTLSVMKTDSGYVPCVSWLNSEGTANGVKYALLRDVDTGDGNTESLWDVQIVPAVVDGGNHYVTGGELVYVEGKSGSWETTEDSVSMGDCDSVVGFNTGRMDVVFLKSEK